MNRYYDTLNPLPYEKFENLGPSGLSDEELLAIIIRTGTKERSALMLARDIMELAVKTGQGNGLLFLEHLSLEEIMSVKGIGKVKAIRLKCVTEFSKRIAKQSYGKSIRFLNPGMISDYYMEQVRHLEEENLLLIMTDSKNQLLKEVMISKGTVNMSVASPREIFLTAVKMRAVHLILLHNHPSGDPNPSKEDYDITKRIRDAGQLLNIPLVDHIIIGDNKYISFKELGYL